MPKPDFTSLYKGHNYLYENKISEVIRVNQAGEFGAKVIYEAQLYFTKNPQNKQIILTMLEQEEEHLKYFETLAKARISNKKLFRPSFLLPLWKLVGFMIGSFSAIFGFKYILLVTEKIEEVIEKHYLEQLEELKLYYQNSGRIELDDFQKEELQELIKMITKFRLEEMQHMDFASEANFDEEGNIFSSFIGNMVNYGCKFAIAASKKL